MWSSEVRPRERTAGCRGGVWDTEPWEGWEMTAREHLQSQNRRVESDLGRTHQVQPLLKALLGTGFDQRPGAGCCQE